MIEEYSLSRTTTVNTWDTDSGQDEEYVVEQITFLAFTRPESQSLERGQLLHEEHGERGTNKQQPAEP